MLLVSTTLGVSEIHGIGLFSRYAIRKDTPIWRFDPAIDIRITSQILRTLARPARIQVETYMYLDNRTGECILCGDDARFLNHSSNPNVVDEKDDPYLCRASRDIRAGEELTQNYFSFDLLAGSKLSKHVIDWHTA